MGVFSPAGNTQLMALTTASGSVTLTRSNTVIRLYNAGPGTAFVRWSNDTTSAANASTDIPIPQGDIEVFEKGASTVFYAVSDTTANLYITQGEGE